MKNSLWIIILIVVAILSFLVGYSLAPTDVASVRHSVQQATTPAGGSDAGGYGASGGHEAASGAYGAPAAGGYGAPVRTGAHEAPATGGYGAPAAGGYGAPSGGYGQ